MSRSGRVILLVVVGALMMGALTSCSIIGKRRTEDGWQVSVLNGRDFKDKQGGYILAIYDGNLPADSQFSVLQLWSGSKDDDEGDEKDDD